MSLSSASPSVSVSSASPIRVTFFCLFYRCHFLLPPSVSLSSGSSICVTFFCLLHPYHFFCLLRVTFFCLLYPCHFLQPPPSMSLSSASSIRVTFFCLFHPCHFLLPPLSMSLSSASSIHVTFFCLLHLSFSSASSIRITFFCLLHPCHFLLPPHPCHFLLPPLSVLLSSASSSCVTFFCLLHPCHFLLPPPAVSLSSASFSCVTFFCLLHPCHFPGCVCHRSEPGLYGVAFCGGDDLQVASVVLDANVRSQADAEAAVRRLERSHIRQENSIAFMFSCIGRGESYYRAPAVDSRAFRKVFRTTPLLGFFGNGEIGYEYLPDYSKGSDHKYTVVTQCDMEEGGVDTVLPEIHHSYSTVIAMLSWQPA